MVFGLDFESILSSRIRAAFREALKNIVVNSRVKVWNITI